EPERVAVGIDAGLAGVIELLEGHQCAAVIVGRAREALVDGVACRLVAAIDAGDPLFGGLLGWLVGEDVKQSHGHLSVTESRCAAVARSGRRTRTSGTTRASCVRSSYRPAECRRPGSAAASASRSALARSQAPSAAQLGRHVAAGELDIDRV